ncbi:hypothetical protein CL655_03430 [bacterium]|nr:hypothetical protein [bacterium]
MSKPISTNSIQSVWLYRFVFGNRLVRWFSTWVLLVMFSQPVSLVFANEVPTEIETDTVAEVEETQPADTGGGVETGSSISAEDIAPPEEIASEVVQPEPEIEEDQPSGTPAAPPDSDEVVPDPDLDDTSSASSTPPVQATSTSVLDEESVTDSADEDNLLADSAAEAASDVAATTSPVVPLSHTGATNQNYYQFSKDDCVRVADGSYYCGSSAPEPPPADSFYVALDGDGDREIFAVMEGKTYQITNNKRDDAAPYYDAQSDTLVWHTLISGRYQIMVYDFDEETETQLTAGRSNNMEPTRQGDIIVWQQWGSESWEIMLHDGESVRQLTDNTMPDVAPSVSEGFVVWKRMYDGNQEVVVYDIKNEEESRIDDASVGASVQNARMLLVYEGLTPEGDRVIRGFDPITQELVPIEALPAELPDELPSSDPTNEVRALVQYKPTLEEDEIVSEPLMSGTGSSATTATSSAPQTEPAPAATSTPAEASDNPLILDLATSTVPEKSPAPDVLPDPEFDLVIPPAATSTEQ